MIYVNLAFLTELSHYGIVYHADNIVSSPTLDTFKARLDEFWENQDVRYNWKAVHRKSK